MSINDEVDISCIHQTSTASGLLCNIASTGGRISTNHTDEYVCANCQIGLISRSICPNIGGTVDILKEFMHGYQLYRLGAMRLWCLKRQRGTTLSDCKNCSLVSSETTKASFERASGLFTSMGFENALDFLTASYRKINIEQDYDGAIKDATVSLESTLTYILQKLNVTPSDKTVTGLYSEVRDNLKIGDEFSIPHLKQVLGSCAGAISGLGAMRNDLSDAHGKGLITPELYESYAELALNLSATMSTFVIRRCKEQKPS